MKRVVKVVAWVCLLSTFLSGCYSHTLIVLDGGGERRVSSDNIEWVVTKGGTSYHLTVPPILVKDTLVIRLRGGEGIKIHSDEIDYIIANDGTKHMFDGQPVIVNDAIVIRPRVDEKDEIYSASIECVTMKDGTEYEFDTPPFASDSAILFNPLVQIPLAEVVQMSSGGEKDKLYMDRIQSVVTKDGTKYEFTASPKISHETLVGVAVNKPIILPLSEVASVSVREFNWVKSVIWGVLAIYIVGGSIAIGLSGL